MLRSQRPGSQTAETSRRMTGFMSTMWPDPQRTRLLWVMRTRGQTAQLAFQQPHWGRPPHPSAAPQQAHLLPEDRWQGSASRWPLLQPWWSPPQGDPSVSPSLELH